MLRRFWGPTPSQLFWLKEGVCRVYKEKALVFQIPGEKKQGFNSYLSEACVTQNSDSFLGDTQKQQRAPLQNDQKHVGLSLLYSHTISLIAMFDEHQKSCWILMGVPLCPLHLSLAAQYQLFADGNPEWPQVACQLSSQ